MSSWSQGLPKALVNPTWSQVASSRTPCLLVKQLSRLVMVSISPTSQGKYRLSTAWGPRQTCSSLTHIYRTKSCQVLGFPLATRFRISIKLKIRQIQGRYTGRQWIKMRLLWSRMVSTRSYPWTQPWISRRMCRMIKVRRGYKALKAWLHSHSVMWLLCLRWEKRATVSIKTSMASLIRSTQLQRMTIKWCTAVVWSHQMELWGCRVVSCIYSSKTQTRRDHLRGQIQRLEKLILKSILNCNNSSKEDQQRPLWEIWAVQSLLHPSRVDVNEKCRAWQTIKISINQSLSTLNKW